MTMPLPSSEMTASRKTGGGGGSEEDLIARGNESWPIEVGHAESAVTLITKSPAEWGWIWNCLVSFKVSVALNSKEFEGRKETADEEEEDNFTVQSVGKGLLKENVNMKGSFIFSDMLWTVFLKSRVRQHKVLKSTAADRTTSKSIWCPAKDSV
jgi:hypothetical protein